MLAGLASGTGAMRAAPRRTAQACLVTLVLPPPGDPLGSRDRWGRGRACQKDRTTRVDYLRAALCPSDSAGGRHRPARPLPGPRPEGLAGRRASR